MKKIIKSILLSFMLFLLGISGVSAATKDLEITDFKLQSKSDTATVDNVTLDGNNITSSIVFNQVDDFVSFNLTIKNNSDDKYKIISVEDNNGSQNLSITYDYDKDYFGKDKTTSVKIKLKYEKALTDKEKLDLDNLNIKINFEKEDGSKGSIVINPTTGDSIIRFIVLGLVSLAGLALIFVKRKKKIGGILLVLVGILIPFAAMANEKYEINLKFTNIEIKGVDQTPAVSESTTFVDGETVRAFIADGSGTFRKATADEYNAKKGSLTDEDIVSANDSESPIYLWNDNGDILYYSESPTIYMNEDSSFMFSNSHLKNIDLSGMDSSKVVDMGGMFKGSSSLESVDLTGIDTSNVTNMSSMFQETGLTELSLASFDTSKVTDMSSMFKDSSNLTSLDISDLDTSAVTDMNSMFANSPKLETITVSNLWDTSAVTNGLDMFAGDEFLVGQEGTEYDTNNNDLEYAQIDNGVLDPGYLSEKDHVVDTSSTIITGSSMRTKLADLISLAVDDGSSGSGSGSGGSETHDEDWDPDECPAADDPNSGYDCYSSYGSNYAYGADAISKFRKATREEYRAARANFTRRNLISKSDEEIPVYGWVEGDSFVYYSVAKTIYLNADCREMFYESKFESIDLSGLDSSRVTDMSRMFSSAENLSSINVSGFDTSNVTTMERMFERDRELVILDLSSFSLENVESLRDMFYDDESLSTIYVSDLWDPRNDYDNEVATIESENMFSGCYDLVGQEGTEYDYYQSDALYAIIDGTDGRQGYLSEKDSDVSQTAMFRKGEFVNDKFDYMHTYGKSFRKATEEEYNDAKDSLTKSENLVSVNSIAAIYMWETSDYVLYYSTSEDIYLNMDASYMFADTSFTSIDLSGIKTSYTTNMSYMFYDCSYLENLVLEDPSITALMNMNNNNLGANVMDANNGITPVLIAILMVGITFGVLAFVFKGFEFKKPKLTVGFVAGTVVVVSLAAILWNTGIIKVFATDNNQNNNEIVHTFDTSNVTNMEGMFYDCSSLTSLDLSIFDTSKVTSMESMFYYCSSLKSIDLSSFNIDRLTNMSYMFGECYGLETIYVSNLWDARITGTGANAVSAIASNGMFVNSEALVGEKGTAYNSEKTDGGYAKVDGGFMDPGYLTLKGNEKTPETFAVVGNTVYNCFSDGGSMTTCYSQEEAEEGNMRVFRQATKEEYNAVKDLLLSGNNAAEYDSPKPVYVWYENEEVLYYSEADFILMNYYVDSMFRETPFEVIDLSGMYAQNVEYTRSMFKDCPNLTTIYPPKGWDNTNWNDGGRIDSSDSTDMFKNSPLITGGSGTTYDADHIDIEYARIDSGSSKPGYFTSKN